MSPQTSSLHTPAAPRRWLTQAEAAEHLGVNVRTLRNYVARGYLPAHRIRGSRLVRYDRDDLDAMLAPIPTAGGGHGAA